MQTGNEAYAVATALLQEMIRDGNENPLKAFLGQYSPGRSVGGGTGELTCSWSEIKGLLGRASLSQAQLASLEALYPRAAEAWFRRAVDRAVAYGTKDDVGMMEVTFDGIRRAAERNGAVANAGKRVDESIRKLAPGLYDRAVATAKESAADSARPWRLESALGTMQTYGPLAGLTQDQITAAKAPYMSQYHARFERSVAEYASQPKRGYWRNHVKDTAKRMWTDAQRVLGNDKLALKRAKQAIDAAKKECARVTALSYLSEKPNILGGFSLIQANIYARMAGINTFRIWGIGVSPEAKAFFDARRAFVAQGGPGLMVGYAVARVVNLINFVRGVSFYT